MATCVTNACVRCAKVKRTFECRGCLKQFCLDHMAEHQNELRRQLIEIKAQYVQLQNDLEKRREHEEKCTSSNETDEYKCESVDNNHDMIPENHQRLRLHIFSWLDDLNEQLTQVVKQLTKCSQEDDFLDTEIQYFSNELKRLKELLQNGINHKAECMSKSSANPSQCDSQSKFFSSVKHASLPVRTTWI